jgi:hypothetical protein
MNHEDIEIIADAIRKQFKRIFPARKRFKQGNMVFHKRQAA